MQRLKFSCLDIILFSAFAYAISDNIKIWQQYQSCSLSLHVYIIVSVITLLVFRLMHFLGQFIAGDTESVPIDNLQPPAQNQNFAWNRLNRLRAISIV